MTDMATSPGIRTARLKPRFITR